MKLGVNDTKAKGYKVAALVLNICTSYACLLGYDKLAFLTKCTVLWKLYRYTDRHKVAVDH